MDENPKRKPVEGYLIKGPKAKYSLSLEFKRTI
jgi:hypothetical protein